MPIPLTCSGCDVTIKAPDTSAGKRVKCPRCGTILDVPDGSEDTPRRAGGFAKERGAPAPPRASRWGDRDDDPEPRGAGRARRGREDDFDDEPVSRSTRRRRERDFEEDEDRPRRRAAGGGNSVALGLGIASLASGVIALPFAFIPCIGFLSLPLSGLGLLLGLGGGIMAAVRKWEGIGFPIAGTAVSTIAVGVGLFWLVWMGAMVNSTQRQVALAQQQAAQQAQLAAQQAQQAEAQRRQVEERQRQALKAQGWVEANVGPARVGDVEVRVNAVRVAPVTAKGPGGRPAFNNQRRLQVSLSLRNLSAAQNVTCEGWSEPSAAFPHHQPRLTDSTNMPLNRANLGAGVEVVGQLKRVVIRPGQLVTDLLVFDEPGWGRSELRLELPASAFGEPGKSARFLIPASMVQR
jgi:hypothetical protein